MNTYYLPLVGSITSPQLVCHLLGPSSCTTPFHLVQVAPAPTIITTRYLVSVSALMIRNDLICLTLINPSSPNGTEAS